ncbi:uncharacterized protein STEHIDRAFT_160806 [Stereum hirsutum FP-91666 SS1]|uniref:uncharacterized protein n=1 Tax=Stereum hirsutum (strain FP-91666) TaxID=721885 RepID=UPI0004449A37|nr:uncharacterized protein STEHIDRAFT_160806 [Stereum hirsutum FP-91666 SS1]EIM82251.1 hypothetical protein STEHIDRAFT_160806 [Stereum hirsutum FP-91666 SS1]
MKVAVEGCCHGELGAIYKEIANLERRNGYKVDLLLCCGDFQAIRNHQDLMCMAVPPKYRKLGEFYQYYTGELVAPVLTIIIGGNHESSSYLWELYHGGWLAPNIYFLGHAGCVQVNGVRIAGASGIFNGREFRKGHYERVPYDNSAIRSIYHIREYNVRRLSLLSSPTIFLSHDWPQSIPHFGDLPSLLRRKAFFRADIESGQLGSPPLMDLLRTLKPEWWFAAHLHVKFEALVRHESGPEQIEQATGVTSGEDVKVGNPDEIVIEDDGDEVGEADAKAPSSEKATDTKVEEPTTRATINPDEILLDDEEEEVDKPPPPPPAPAASSSSTPFQQGSGRQTKFLALDKCLPRRQFLEVVDVPIHPSFAPASAEPKPTPIFSYDPEWLTITRAFQPYFSLTHQQATYPTEDEAWEMLRKEAEWVRKNVPGKLGGAPSADAQGESQGEGKEKRKENDKDEALRWQIEKCQKFVMTAPGPRGNKGPNNQQPPAYNNPQTEAFTAMLEIENKINPQGLSVQSSTEGVGGSMSVDAIGA